MAAQIEPIQRMVSELARLPGIGQKTAQRLAYHIVGLPLEEVHALAAALWQGRKAIRYCERCGNFSAAELCSVCAEERRALADIHGFTQCLLGIDVNHDNFRYQALHCEGESDGGANAACADNRYFISHIRTSE